MRHSTPPASGTVHTRRGFTIVEILVAMIILTFGVLALASTTIYVVRATKYGDITTERSAAVQTVIEQLRATDFDSLSSGSDTIGNFAVKWAVSSSSRTALVTLISAGPGLKSAGSGPPLIRPSVVDTFQYRIIR